MSGGERGAIRPHWPLAALALLVVVGLIVAAVLTAEVLERGVLLPAYTPATVERVEVLGGIELWVAREPLARLDVLNGLILMAGSAVCLLATLRVSPRPRLRWFFGLLAAGLGYLALDELLVLHETIGYNLDFLADLPGIDSPEDVVFALFALPAGAFLLGYRDIFAASRNGLRLVLLGVALFLVAAALDVSDLFDEQWVEPAASLAIVGGIALLALHYLRAPTPAGSLPQDAGDTERDRSSAARA